MVERICGMCGAAWGKSYKFCPADGSLLVAVDTVVPPQRATPLRRSRKTDPALVGVESRRRLSATREFAEGASEAGGGSAARSGEAVVEVARPAWTSPIFTRSKSHTAAAFDETAYHKRPQVDGQGAIVFEGAPSGPKTHPLFVPRVGEELV